MLILTSNHLEINEFIKCKQKQSESWLGVHDKYNARVMRRVVGSG